MVLSYAFERMMSTAWQSCSPRPCSGPQAGKLQSANMHRSACLSSTLDLKQKARGRCQGSNVEHGRVVQ